jgi:pimeloyl-ACP methyl ester carboxylesterase
MISRFAALLLWCLSIAPAFGQGLINLNNRGLAQVYDATGKQLTGTSFVAQIWYGPSANSLNKSFAPAPFRVSTTVSPGTWNPGATGGPGAIATLDGFAPGSTVTLRVAVWDSSIAGIGAAQALARLPGTGISEPFTYTIPTDLLAIPGGMENMRPFSLVPTGGLVNRPPIANPQAVSVVEDGNLSIPLYGSDPEGASLTSRITKQPLNGSLSIKSNILTYSPKPGFEGIDEFTFVVNDGVNDSLEALVTINVTPKPEIVSAVWSIPNGVSTCYSGTVVSLGVEVKGFNVNETVTFEILEFDTWTRDDFTDSITARVFQFESKTYVSAQWVSRWVDDAGTIPQFYFTANGRGIKSDRSQLLSVIPPDTDDTLASATVLGGALYSNERTGSIELPDDVDIYKIGCQAGQTITLDVDRNTGSLYPLLRFFNSKGLEITNNVGGGAPTEQSTNEAFIRFQVPESGDYFVGVSGVGNFKYNPINGQDDTAGSSGPYRLTVSTGFANHITRSGSSEEYLVDICREDKVGAPIDPNKNTWVIIHGWNSSRTKPNISNLVRSVISARPADQVVTLDWSSLADTGLFNIIAVLLLDPLSQAREAAKGISPSGKWAAEILKHYGLKADKINVIGHSFGCHVGDQIAAGFQPEKLRSIIALDPAVNAVPSGFDSDLEVNYLAKFVWSWVFVTSKYGNGFLPWVASEAFVVDTNLGSVDAHSAAVDFFADVLKSPAQLVAALFNLDRISLAIFGPWVIDQFFSPFHAIRFPSYEAIISAPSGVTPSISYRTNSPSVFVDYPAPNSVMRDRIISVGGRASDLGRGDSGISSVMVNGSIAVGGVSSAAQTAFWSNTVALKLGTNTVRVVVTDASAINPGMATNSVVVKYQPEFIDLPLQVFDELLLASLDLAAEDKALSERVLSHSLKSGPTGLSVTASGRLDWVPTESQGPSTNLVEVAVTDGDVRTTKRIVLVVREVNTPPSLAALPDVTLAPGVEWLVPAVGTDVDLPAQALGYTLKSGPIGVSIHPATGIIRWTPPKADGPGVYPVTILVTDSFGAAGEQSFRVTVSGPAQAPILAIGSANADGSITLQIRADRGAIVELEHSGDLKTWVLVRPINGQGMDNPVGLVMPTDPNTQAVFWRLRIN